jgi:F0F1-type ATP synthase assembly protein I
MAGSPARPPARTQWQDAAAAWNAVFEFTAAVAVYGVGGWFADKWLHTGHVLFVLGLVLGMVLGVYVLMKRSTQAAGTYSTPGSTTPRATPRTTTPGTARHDSR